MLEPVTHEERRGRIYTRLRRRIDGWLSGHHVGERVRGYLLLLPDLFVLVTRLMRDRRVAPGIKAQLLAVSIYVISPIDLVPDFALPVGLTDDTVAVAFLLSRIIQLMGQAGAEVLRDHWEGPGDILGQIQGVLQTADRVLSSRVTGGLRRLFG